MRLHLQLLRQQKMTITGIDTYLVPPGHIRSILTTEGYQVLLDSSWFVTFTL